MYLILPSCSNLVHFNVLHFVENNVSVRGRKEAEMPGKVKELSEFRESCGVK
jgi:hypothetical protein